ncbi:MAG: hypothetical protein ABSF16_16330 [Terracidiphilus sp.]
MDHTLLKRLLGSGIVVAMLALIIAGLQFYGVINMALGRSCFLAVLSIGVAGIVFSEWVWKQNIWLKIAVGFVASLVLGIGIFWLDTWAKTHGSEQSTAAAMPASPPASSPIPFTPPATITQSTPENVPPSSNKHPRLAQGTPDTISPRPEPSRGTSVSVNTPAAQQTCIGSNCINGPNFGNPTVNNFAPPQRTLTDPEKGKFAALVSALPADIRIGVHCVGTDEAAQYGWQFSQAIPKDHWAFYEKSVIPPSTREEGVYFLVNKGDKDLAENLIRQLVSVGMEMDPIPTVAANIPKGTLWLHIGQMAKK